MAKNTIADLDTVAANNLDVLNQSTAGSASANTIDTIFQNTLGLLARFYKDMGGDVTVGGTADAVTITSASTYQALEDGLLIAFKAGGANTGAATLNLDSLGVKAIRRQGDSALSAGDMIEDGVYLLRYDEAYNSAAGAWVLLNPNSPTSYVPGGTDVAVADGGTNISSYTEGDLLYASAATTLAKLAKGTAGQVLIMNSGATAPEWGAGAPLSKYWESSEQTITAAGSLTLAHDLGAEPKMAQALLVCKTAQLGYEVGDKVFINPAGNDPGSAAARGLSLVGDADEFRIKYGNAASVVSIVNQSDGAIGTLTPANWRLVIRAWA